MTEFDTCACGHARCNHDSTGQCLRCNNFTEFRIEDVHVDLEPVEEDAKYNDPDWWKKRGKS